MKSINNLIILFNLLVLIIFSLSNVAATYDNDYLLEKAIKNRTLHDDSDPATLYQKGNSNGPITGWFLSKDEMDSLIKKLVDTYNQKEVTPALDPRDQKIIRALRNNLEGYYINEPVLEFKKSYSSLVKTYSKTPIYKITGWKSSKLVANSSAVEKFFRLFLAGAHFVIMGPNSLLKAVRALPESAKNSKHSHYSQTEQRLVFPNITWKTKSPAPIIAALLIDAVKLPDSDSPMTFFQLEGWPVHKGSDIINDTYYHGKDYLLHRDTVWNISTYGMSPYSEKRGTTIFLTKTPIDFSKPFTFGKTTFSSEYQNYAEDLRK